MFKPILHQSTTYLVIIAMICVADTSACQDADKHHDKSKLNEIANRNVFCKALSVAIKNHSENDHSLIACNDLSVCLNGYYRKISSKDISSVEHIVNAGRFIGFAEKSIGTTIPDWWCLSLINSKSNGQSFSPQSYGKFLDYNKALQLNYNGHSKISEDSITIKGNSIKKSSIDKMFNDLGDKSLRYMTAECDGDNIFISFYGNTCNGLVLYCIDKNSFKTKWHQIVWGGAIDLTLGRSSHYASIKVVDNSVVVFGCDSTCAYIESFSSALGKPQFRFNTRFLD